MHGVLPAQAQRAIFIADINVSESLDREFADKNVSEGAKWFGRLAKLLSPKKPGATLAYLLDEDEDRNHHRWAAADAEPRASVLASLLRSGQGDRVLAYIMRGSTVAWWRDHCAAARDAAIFRTAVAEREQQLSLDLA